MMKRTVAALVFAGFALASGAALAQTADDIKWINQCLNDNKGGAPEAIVMKYCSCMNNKMSNSDSQSISTWERSHPAERAACDKESGWK